MWLFLIKVALSGFLRRTGFFYFFMLCVSLAFSQQDSLVLKENLSGTVYEKYYVIENTDIRQGEYTMYYNNILLCKGYYYKGEKTGPWTKFYPNGVVSTTGAYINGKKNGLWKFIYENKKTASVSQFDHGKETGTWIGFYMNGDTSCVMHYDKDSDTARIEKLTMYYQKKPSEKDLAAKKQKEIVSKKVFNTYLDEVTFYYDNGMLYKRCFYIDNILDGPFETFYKDGKPWESFMYDSGKLMEIYFIKSPYGDDMPNNFVKGTGTANFYSCDGNLESVIEYKDGIEDGKAVYYYRGSTPKQMIKRAEGNYKNGSEIGEWNYYTDYHLTEKVLYYGDGKAHSTEYLTGGGRVESDHLYGVYNGEVKEFNKYKEQISLYTYRNGYLHGKYEDETRMLTQKGEYYFGSPVNMINYYKGDKLRISDTIVNDITVDSSFYKPDTTADHPYKRSSEYAYVDHFLKATFYGGIEKEAEHIAAYIHHPDSAKNNNVYGIVLLELTINSFGEVNGIKLIKGIGYGCNEEAIKLVEKMPLFEPALYRGIPVESKLIRAIRFLKPGYHVKFQNSFYKYDYMLNSSQLINYDNFE